MPANPRYVQPVSVYPDGYDAGDVEFILLDTTAGTATNLHVPVTSSVFHCVGLQGSLNTLGGTVWLEDTDATQLTGKMYQGGNTVFTIGGGFSICKTAASKGIAINTATAGFHGVAQFIEVTG